MGYFNHLYLGMFHNILLLGPGGKTVYQGTVSDAAHYFSSLGFNTPANVNPADFYMDVIGGSVKIGEEEIDLFEAWKKRSGTEEETARPSSEADLDILPACDSEGWYTSCLFYLLCTSNTQIDQIRQKCDV